MAISDKNLKDLDGLFLRGQKLMNEHYANYVPRTTDGGHFGLYVSSQKHINLVRRWQNKVLDILQYDMREQYYAGRFLNAKPPKSMKALPPDLLHYSLVELTDSLKEMRQLQFAQLNTEYLNDNEKITARFDYENAKILLISEDGGQYPIYTFRAGSPKAVFEFAIKRPDGIARKGDFRAGGLGGATVSSSFVDLFRQLIKCQSKDVLLKPMVQITSGSIRFNRDPFVLTRKELRFFVDTYK